MVHADGESLPAAQVALASGKHNVRGAPRPPASTVAFKMQMQIGSAAAAMLNNVVHLSMFAGGYAGVCRIEDGIATICWVVERDRLDGAATYWQRNGSWQAHADFLSHEASFFAALLDDAKPLWDKPVAVAAIPYGFIRRTVISDTIYPVGDQLVVIPSYTGDGTSLALHTGMRAAQTVLQNRSASEFQRAAIDKIQPQIAWAKLANVAFVNARAQRWSAAIARVMPWALPQLATFVTKMTRLRA
jgi:flavin-dependent dehydrogenase